MIPDVLGNYTVQMSVSDAAGGTAIDLATVPVTAAEKRILHDSVSNFSMQTLFNTDQFTSQRANSELK